ncbi:hypothetical protein [Agromyces laixinhei]|uniref:hypothetical protein n=1 Tax=Agromyces laixinhei TaxID=2585717 RepID=UPI0011163BBF|nr:hypothetical protein [Agromyces laixinhei]
MSGDGQDQGDETDWLLAQLAGGDGPRRDDPPQPVAPPAQPEQQDPPAPRTPAPRREEVLDWFSEAPAARSDAATRALPVVGAPAPQTPATPPAPAEPAAPAWTPPFAVTPPRQPPAPGHLTAVEPPVGGSPPIPPSAPAAPSTPAPPPVEPSAPAADSPFAGFAPPPVARQSFTPVGSTEPPAPAEPPAQPHTAAPPSTTAQPPAEPIVPVHPTTPPTVPAGWNDRSPRTPAPAAHFDDELWAALNEPEEVAPTPAAAPPVQRAPVTPPAPTTPITPTAPAPPAAPATPAEPSTEAGAFNTTPFPAFASARSDDDPTRKPPAPVDDLLASLGSGAPRDRGTVPPPASSGSGAFGAGASGDPFGAGSSGANPPTEPVPSGLDALGLGFDDDAVDLEPADRPMAADREPPAPSEHSDAGFAWNLRPDPTGRDPKDAPESVASAFRPATAPDAAGQVDEVRLDGAQREWRDEADSAEPDWAFPADASPPTDTVALEASDDDAMGSLFGAAGVASAAANDPFGQRPANDPFAAPTGGQPAGSGQPTAPGQQRRGSGGSGGRGGAGGTGGTGGGSGGPGGPGAPRRTTRTTRTLIWVAGGLVLLLVLAGLYFFGTQLAGGGGGAGATGDGSPSASASEAAVPAPTGPQPAGVHAWDTLFGGECIEPFESVWAEEFTVVDCAAPHAAQLVYRGTLPGDAAAPFPGEAALAEQMPALCRAAGVFEPTLVAGIPDMQVQGSFPVTEEQWAEGQRSYYCFANRAGGEPLTGPINGPGPAPAA